jgi:hypothetical protein
LFYRSISDRHVNQGSILKPRDDLVVFDRQFGYSCGRILVEDAPSPRIAQLILCNDLTISGVYVLPQLSAALLRAERSLRLFYFRNGRAPAGDLDTVANLSAKYRTSERRDIGYATLRGFCFVFTNDAKSLCSAIVPLHGDCSPEAYFAFIGCWFYDLRA